MQGVDALLDDAVLRRVCPGGVLVVADEGRVVHRRAFGVRAWVDQTGAPAPPVAVTLETIYDVASLTKPLVTAALVARLVEAGRLAFDTPACAFVPELRDPRVRVRDLLAHAAGFPAWIPLWKQLLDDPTPRETMLRLAASTPPESAPGARGVYSDVGFILLGFVVERCAGARLDELARRALFEPLGLPCGFVDLARGDRPAPVAPTELDPRRGLLSGEVHDENCHAAGGILGHAGLFATAEDVSQQAAAWVRSWHGERFPGGFPPDIVREMWRPSGVPGSVWRLGWEVPSAQPGVSHAGDRWPRDGVGHLGFTGTSLWIDPARRRWVVLLTNRVHPSRENQAIRQLRPAVHDEVLAALD